ncbi:MAG: alpha/beta fold hydrolase [Ilumatobacteraceae bacterium]
MTADARESGRVQGKNAHEVRTGSVRASELDVTYLECGDGPLAVCMHGFPDSPHTWRHLMPELAKAGYRAVAPFMRGYAPTSVPSSGVYQTAALARDANALHEALGGDERAVIIGHDWGAPSVCGAAIDAPERWSKVVSMAVPPGPALGAAFLGNLAQVQRSWYMFFFQHGLSNHVVAANDLAFIDMLWSQWSPDYQADVDLSHVKSSLRDSANLQAALGYYRATLGDGKRDPELADLQQRMGGEYPKQPLLYLHGENDGCIGREVAEAARGMSPANVRYEFIEKAGHFMQLEQPSRVNALILDFLRR